MINIRNIVRRIRVASNNVFAPALPTIKQPKLIMTLLVKDEGDILEENLIFHKAMGVDGFIVTNNNSSDNTAKIISQYHKLGWVLEVINEDATDYSQIEWVDRMIKLAKNKYKADWIINADADEFWTSAQGNLKSTLTHSSANKIFCPIYNVLPKDEVKFYNNNLLVKKQIDTSKYDLAKYNIFGVSIPKVLHRTQGYKMIYMGNHEVDMAPGKIAFIRDIVIYHYNIRSLNHFKRKMINGGENISNNTKLSLDAGAHWRYFYNGYKEGKLDLDQEYNKYIGRKYWNALVENNVIIQGNVVKDFFNSLRKNK